MILQQCSGLKLAESVSQRTSRQAKQVCIAASGSLEYAGHVRAQGHGSSSALVTWDVTAVRLHGFGYLPAGTAGLQVMRSHAGFSNRSRYPCQVPPGWCVEHSLL